jgi:hypothetical protein
MSAADRPTATHREDPREELLELAAEAALRAEPITAADIERGRQVGLDLEHEALMMELAAAELAVAELARDGLAEMPVPVRRAVERSAEAPPIAGRIGGPRTRDLVAAAAGIAFGAVATALVLRSGGDGPEPAIDPVRFIASRPRAVHWPWTGTEDAHVVGAVRGEAYFDPETDEGLLEIEGLAPNDPTVEQYQLWIFDRERDERYPVDGGVFDVRQPGRVVIPVRARLGVSQPVMFAVTVEKPGGAVVSERRIALVARP